MNVEDSVRERYTEGALQRQESLCCPVSYDTGLLALLPDEIIEKDYGCGDPSRYVKPGDTVLDLGSGGGKICYMAAQLVGDTGQVIGVDMNTEMLALARRHQADMAHKLGGDRVRFLRGYIQDLALDIDALDAYLAEHPVGSQQDYAALKSWEAAQRSEQPLIQDQSIDLVISNCVLNLVADTEKHKLLQEIFRVLKPGGRVAIADIVSDQPVPRALKENPELWSGCLSGAFQETEFADVFAQTGFQAVTYDKWDEQPWQVVEGIAFRSVTLTAVKPLTGMNGVHGSTVIYRGPFTAVIDDAGSRYERGQRVAVSAQTHDMLTAGAYNNAFIALPESGTTSAGCCSTPEQGAACGSDTPKPADGLHCC